MIGLLGNSYSVVCCCRDDEQKYQQFVKSVTSDILRRGIYTNRSDKPLHQSPLVFVASANDIMFLCICLRLLSVCRFPQKGCG